MSHTVKVEIQFSVTEIENLKKAFEAFGWKMKENSSSRIYGGKSETTYAYVAINPKGCFDIGIAKNKGKLELYTDFYDKTIGSQLGETLEKLKAKYAENVIFDEYVNQGYICSKTVDSDTGNTIIIVENYA